MEEPITNRRVLFIVYKHKYIIKIKREFDHLFFSISNNVISTKNYRERKNEEGSEHSPVMSVLFPFSSASFVRMAVVAALLLAVAMESADSVVASSRGSDAAGRAARRAHHRWTRSPRRWTERDSRARPRTRSLASTSASGIGIQRLSVTLRGTAVRTMHPGTMLSVSATAPTSRPQAADAAPDENGGLTRALPNPWQEWCEVHGFGPRPRRTSSS